MNLILVRTNSLVCEMNLYDECLFDFLVLSFSFSLSLFPAFTPWKLEGSTCLPEFLLRPDSNACLLVTRNGQTMSVATLPGYGIRTDA